jgi:hypothetical protein
MFTPSVVLLVIANTVAATGAILVALQAAMFETGRAALPSSEDAAGINNADLSWQQGEVVDAARPEKSAILEGNLSLG